MLELLREDLEECIELLRQIENSTETEQWQLLGELKMTNDPKELSKIYELCELYIHYYDSVKDKIK
jgi:hypothetical protein